MNRPTSIQRLMMRAELESMWSTCQRLRVGSVAFDNEGLVLASSYNGAPSNVPHCNEKDKLEGRCTYCIHSEKNLINYCAKLGVKMQGLNVATLYRPCVGCSNDLVQVKINRLYYRWDYDTDGMKDYVLEMLQKSFISVRQLPYTHVEKTFTESLTIWQNSWGHGSLSMLSE